VRRSRSFDTIGGDFNTIGDDFDTTEGDFNTVGGDFDTGEGDFDKVFEERVANRDDFVDGAGRLRHGSGAR
jgi:hypothetical protein